VIVGVLRNPGKEPLFSLNDRLAILSEVFSGRPEIEVSAFEGLLVEFLRARGASVVVRGIRSAADLDYERHMALTNHHMLPAADTVLLLPAAEFGHISSSLVREIASLGGSVRGLVPPAVESWIERRPRGSRTASV
jgi:pantetheine-phosphate adenylyltransferase